MVRSPDISVAIDTASKSIPVKFRCLQNIAHTHISKTIEKIILRKMQSWKILYIVLTFLRNCNGTTAPKDCFLLFCLVSEIKKQSEELPMQILILIGSAFAVFITCTVGYICYLRKKNFVRLEELEHEIESQEDQIEIQNENDALRAQNEILRKRNEELEEVIIFLFDTRMDSIFSGIYYHYFFLFSCSTTDNSCPKLAKDRLKHTSKLLFRVLRSKKYEK